MDDETIVLKREELYQMVWSEPVSKLARGYGLSDRGLGKICARLEIPVPGRGYWQMKKKGLKIPVPPLRPTKKINATCVYIHRKPAPQQEGEEEHKTCDVIAAEMMPENKITVPLSLDSPHDLIVITQRSLIGAKVDTRGLKQPRARGCLDINVGPDNIDRAMLIMDTLVKALETRGFDVTVNNEAPFSTTVSVMDEVIKFAFNEELNRTKKKLSAAQMKEKEKHPWMYSRQEYDYSPNGLLSLKIKNDDYLNTRKTWTDGRRQRLEDCLNSFVSGLIKAAIAIKHLREERERRQREWQEESRRREEAERIRREEEEKLKGLDREIASWQRSQQIRLYIEAVKKWGIQKYGEIKPDSKLQHWLTWATKQADRFDPLAE
ncbi:MAG: hypothetical protein RBT80_23585 [Candidatus Vecturithrix sp.]|jgi:hypothetical protein|nr:hypothetical protein [Candidatus Vecturithrix sp.]